MLEVTLEFVALANRIFKLLLGHHVNNRGRDIQLLVPFFALLRALLGGLAVLLSS